MTPKKAIDRISLDDATRWTSLEHAYGPASDTPGLLRRLDDLPAAYDDSEPWFSLWSSLAHQGDVYSASFAAVPHVVHALSSAPANAHSTYFQFPAWIEICRQKNGVEVPEDLLAAYFAALNRLPSLVAQAAERPWDNSFLLCALSAIAAAKGNTVVAEVVLDLESDIDTEFMEWFRSRH